VNAIFLAKRRQLHILRALTPKRKTDLERDWERKYEFSEMAS
jgi:hypothetical protein